MKLADIKNHISTGNNKVPYYIINMNPATGCISRKLGLCQAGKDCYALKAETQYPACLPYRKRQAKIWEQFTPEQIAGEIIAKQKRAKKMKKVLRFSEAGDFISQKDVDKMADLARVLKSNGWLVYGYTARTDLNLTGLLKVAGVNVSNDGGDWQKQGANRFKMVNQALKGALVCVGDCTMCRICNKAQGKTVQVIKH